MYKPMDRSQPSFLDFNQPMGLKMNSENRWVKIADLVLWDEFEIKYAHLFSSDMGNIAKPLRMALGALIIQTSKVKVLYNIKRIILHKAHQGEPKFLW